MTQRILILGGRGKTGSRLAHILQKKNITHFIATRAPEQPNDRWFDWENPASFENAFAGIDAVYIVAPTNRADHDIIMPPALTIAQQQGVQRFVLLSAASLPKGGPMMGAIHQWLENHTKEWAVLRPSWFMQNMLEARHLTSITQDNVIFSATGNGKLGFIDAQDITQVAFHALTDETPWNCDELPTGPSLLSYADLAQEISAALERDIRHEALTVDQLAQHLETAGLSKDYAMLLAHMDGSISEGTSEVVSDAILRRTGRPATGFANFLATSEYSRVSKDFEANLSRKNVWN
jgi:uncharacterized protein YbjT (DUF2867 family)